MIGGDESDLYALPDAIIPSPIDSEISAVEQELRRFARIDCSTFIQYAFGWPMQVCHYEWQDLFSLENRLVLWAPVEHGKTSQLTGRIIWELGINPNVRIILISNTAGLSTKILASVKQHIMLNQRVRDVFPGLLPELRPKRFAAWHDDKIVVQRDDLDNKDYSVQALGILGAVIGARADRAYLDDVLNFENTLHETARKRTIDWYDSTIESRITAGGQVAFIGSAWHREDAMHVISKRQGWKSARYDATQMLWPQAIKVHGKICGWPRWRLEEKQRSIPALEFNRQFRSIPTSKETDIFSLESIEQCFCPDEPWDPDPRPEWQTYVGVDLNVKKGEARHETAFFIGRSEGAFRIVQRIIARNMDLLEIFSTFMMIEARYHPVLFLVENVAAQDYIVQLFNPEKMRAIIESAGGSIPLEMMNQIPRVEGFATGRNKSDPILGIRGMTIEFEQKRWRIPEHLETRRWAGQLEAFAPEDHPGDILMASWLFSNAVRLYRPRTLISRSVSSRR